MIQIEQIKFRNILNSVGKQALETEIKTDNNILGIASSPSAILAGKREVNENVKFKNEDLTKLLNEIYNNKFEGQADFDSILNKYMEKLGSSVCLPLSLAFARVLAKSSNTSLVKYLMKFGNIENLKSPIPLVTIFSGGVHDQKRKHSLQNIMISVDIHPFSKAVEAITNIYTVVENRLIEQDLLDGYGASSGMIANSITTNQKFSIIQDTINKLKYEKKVSIAIDVAAEHLYKDGKYIYEENILNPDEFTKILKNYINNYNITYIEDPFETTCENMWTTFKLENPQILIVGDDLFATQEKYLNNQLANGVLIKMNQIGTLTGTIKTINRAQELDMTICVSHRSIETEDTFMCDLAVALNAEYIKIGGPRRGDRISKYNQLLRLEGEL